MEIKELGHVVLYVSNLERSQKFYRDILGFKEVARINDIGVAFSSGRTHHELLLLEVGGVPEKRSSPKPGLYHIGFKVGDSIQELKSAYQTLKDNQVTIIGTGDHTFTLSIYILDPDGNELELYVDTSNDWKQDPGLINTPVKPLNLD